MENRNFHIGKPSKFLFLFFPCDGSIRISNLKLFFYILFFFLFFFFFFLFFLNLGGTHVIKFEDESSTPRGGGGKKLKEGTWLTKEEIKKKSLALVFLFI
jgi:hypothetical protein